MKKAPPLQQKRWLNGWWCRCVMQIFLSHLWLIINQFSFSSFCFFAFCLEMIFRWSVMCSWSNSTSINTTTGIFPVMKEKSADSTCWLPRRGIPSIFEWLSTFCFLALSLFSNARQYRAERDAHRGHRVCPFSRPSLTIFISLFGFSSSAPHRRLTLTLSQSSHLYQNGRWELENLTTFLRHIQYVKTHQP